MHTPAGLWIKWENRGFQGLIRGITVEKVVDYVETDPGREGEYA